MESSTEDRVLKLPINLSFEAGVLENSTDGGATSDTNNGVVAIDESASSTTAMASTDNAWSNSYIEPLPTNKEERIQRALEFMSAQKAGHLNGKNVKKHSLRQIALYFHVPKSTLYDRLKNMNNARIISNTDIGDHSVDDTNHGSITDLGNTHDGSNRSVVINTVSIKPSTRAHIQQMKLSIERENHLLNIIHTMAHALGNTMNITQIKSLILSLTSDVSLGKKWVHNFIKRHVNAIAYGSSESTINIRISNSKFLKNNFDHLWKCFLPLYQNTIKKLKLEQKSFVYITRSCIHEQSMSSVFTCFEVSSIDLSMKLISEPTLILFPDYFGKGVKVVYEDMDNNGAVKTSKYIKSSDKLKKQFKFKKLNECFCKLYQNSKESNSIVFFEGFQENYNWEPLQCQDMISLNDFIALPWNHAVLKTKIINIFQNSLRLNIDAQSEIKNTQAHNTPSIEIPLDVYQRDFDQYSQVLFQLLNFPNDMKLPLITEGIVNDTDLSNVFASFDKPVINNIQNNSIESTTTKELQQNYNNPAASSNIFEDATITQLQDIVMTIETNEAKIISDVKNLDSKEILSSIFEKIKDIIPQ